MDLFLKFPKVYHDTVEYLDIKMFAKTDVLLEQKTIHVAWKIITFAAD